MISKELIIPPLLMNFVTTNKCTSSCVNCCFHCNPKRKDKLTSTEINDYICKAIAAYPTIRIVVFSGGECFTLGTELNEIVSYASNKGLRTRVVTNAYWATSFKTAYLKLKELSDLGLNEVNISTGDEHQEWVPYDNVIYAITASLKLGLETVVNVEYSNISKFKSQILFDDPCLKKYLYNRKFHIINGIWMPFKKSTKDKMLKEKELSIDSNLFKEERCTNLFSSININANHHMNACCGLPSEYIPYLKLGDSQKYSLKELYENQFYDLLKIWLYAEGPRRILDYCMTERQLPILKTYNMHLCQICAEIFQDPENIAVISKNYELLYANIILKYSFVKSNSLVFIKEQNIEI